VDGAATTCEANSSMPENPLEKDAALRSYLRDIVLAPEAVLGDLFPAEASDVLDFFFYAGLPERFKTHPAEDLSSDPMPEELWCVAW
jgi:hypothetical protein